VGDKKGVKPLPVRMIKPAKEAREKTII